MLFCGTKLRIRKRSVVTIMGLSFMAAPITACLSHRRSASAERSRHTCVARDRVQETDRKKNVTYLDGKERDSSGTLTSQNTTGIELLTESRRSPFVSPYRELTAGTCGRRGNLPHQDLYPTPKLCNNSCGTNFRDHTFVSCNIPTSPHHAPLPLLCTKLDSPDEISFPSQNCNVLRNAK